MPRPATSGNKPGARRSQRPEPLDPHASEVRRSGGRNGPLRRCFGGRLLHGTSRIAGRSQVPLWQVLGIVLVLISSSVVLLGDPGGLVYAFGAGVAFLIVALCQWVANRWGALSDDDVYDSEGSEPGGSTETAPTPVNLGQ